MIVILESDCRDCLRGSLRCNIVHLTIAISYPSPCCPIPHRLTCLVGLNSLVEDSESDSTNTIDIDNTSSCCICRIWKRECLVRGCLVDVKCSIHIYGCRCSSNTSSNCTICDRSSSKESRTRIVKSCNRNICTNPQSTIRIVPEEVCIVL